ncbi:hypothetical protein BZA70DRAFT_267628 [Myxozyma melibiosi]|uniref:Retrotransposon gag domain-containing protein n=1 Tax=Myxozyma melibiosi TaxID=54550 RepID=A0ABR1F5K5_9ASCO
MSRPRAKQAFAEFKDGWVRNRVTRLLVPPQTNRKVDRRVRRRRDARPWEGTHNEYGISDTELLDIILAGRYSMQIEPASRAIDTTIQLPDMLTFPFQRRLYLRQLARGGAIQVGRDRVTRWFYTPYHKNATYSDLLRGVDAAAGISRFMWKIPKLRPWVSDQHPLTMRYIPPGMATAAFAKSRPAVVILMSSRPSAGQKATYRAVVRKHMRRYLFEALCEVQGITREVAHWSDIKSFEPMSTINDGLSFLLEDHRDPRLIRQEKKEYEDNTGAPDETEQLMVKRSPDYIRDLDGVFVFFEKRGSGKNQAVPPIGEEAVKAMAYAAVQAVVAEYGYVSKEMHDKYALYRRTKAVSEESANEEKEEESIEDDLKTLHGRDSAENIEIIGEDSKEIIGEENREIIAEEIRESTASNTDNATTQKMTQKEREAANAASAAEAAQRYSEPLSPAVQLAHYRTSRRYWRWVVTENKTMLAKVFPGLQQEPRLFDDEVLFGKMMEQGSVGAARYEEEFRRLQRSCGEDARGREGQDLFFPRISEEVPKELLKSIYPAKSEKDKQRSGQRSGRRSSKEVPDKESKEEN